MNRDARRQARRSRKCLARYSTGGPVIHAPADCDGRCHARALSLPPALMPPIWMWLAEEVWPAPEGADFGMTRGMLRELTLIALRDLAALRARVLAALRARTGAPRRECGSWERFRAVLAALGLIGSPRDDARPGLGADVVKCCPHTGPPALPREVRQHWERS